MYDYSKEERQMIIREIISQEEIGDQVKLLFKLHEHGIEVTQATISRDLQEMGMAKIRVRPGVYKYTNLNPKSKKSLWDQLTVLFANFVVEIKGTKNMLLIRTSPGNAHGVASLIDSTDRKEILGTVAGDDTILLIADSDESRHKVEEDLKTLLSSVSKF